MDRYNDDHRYARCNRCGYEHNVDDPNTCPDYDEE